MGSTKTESRLFIAPLHKMVILLKGAQEKKHLVSLEFQYIHFQYIFSFLS